MLKLAGCSLARATAATTPPPPSAAGAHPSSAAARMRDQLGLGEAACALLPCSLPSSLGCSLPHAAPVSSASVRFAGHL